jgi:hypothetical protein
MLDNAAGAAQLLHEAQAKALSEADQCDALAAKTFDQAPELATARARLARIEAELRDAATPKAGPDTAAGDVVVDGDGEVVIDMGALGDFAGMVMDDLASQVATELATMMGDDLATMFD